MGLYLHAQKARCLNFSFSFIHAQDDLLDLKVYDASKSVRNRSGMRKRALEDHKPLSDS